MTASFLGARKDGNQQSHGYLPGPLRLEGHATFSIDLQIMQIHFFVSSTADLTI
jgi:hypothetical protein